MTENIENAESAKDERTSEQVEIDRLKAECEVWQSRYTRCRDEYSRYRQDAKAFTKQSDQTIENLTGKIAAQEEHIAHHHRRDDVRFAEMKQMEDKLTSYSALLNLMADAGRLPIELIEHIDAGISAIHDQGSESPMEVADVKFFTGKNPLQQLRDYLAQHVAENGGKIEFDENGVPQVTIEDDDTEYVTPRTMRETGGTMPAYEPGPDEQKVILDEQAHYVSGPDMERTSYTDAGLPKRPIKDDPQG